MHKCQRPLSHTVRLVLLPAAAAEKAATPKGNKIRFVLEDTLPVSSDSTIKVKTFKKFLDYDLKTLNITGELQTYTHRNGFTHTKMVVTYQDKKTNKVNYLELDFLDNTNKEVNKNTVGGHRCCTGEGCFTSGGCCCNLSQGCICPPGSSSGVLTTATEVMSLGLKSSNYLMIGAFAALKLAGSTTNGTVVIIGK